MPPKGWVECGMAAAKDGATCADAVLSQVSAIGEAALFVATIGSSSAVTASNKLIQVYDKAADSFKRLKEANKVYFDTVAASKQVYDLTGRYIDLNVYLDEVESGSRKLDAVEATRAIAEMASTLDPTGISSILAAYTYNTCDKYGSGVEPEVYKSITSPAYSGLCVDMDDSWKTLMRTCDVNNYSQTWRYDMLSKQLVPERDEGLCILEGGKVDWCYSGTVNNADPKSRWNYDPKTQQLKNVGTGKCLDNGGTNRYLYTGSCHDTNNKHQKFNLAYYFFITNDAHPGKCVDVDDQWKLLMRGCNGSSYMQWWRYDSDSKQIRPKHNEGLCFWFDAKITWCYDKMDKLETQWTWDPKTKRIQSAYNTKMCLDAGPNDIYITFCHDGVNQKFNIYGITVHG